MSDNEDDSDLTYEEILDGRCAPLFDMVERFSEEFCAHALDVIGLSDEDADRLAELIGHDRTHPYASLLRSIKTVRMFRQFAAKMAAVDACNSIPGLISFVDLQEEFDKLPKANA
jgi:hypothetical protein